MLLEFDWSVEKNELLKQLRSVSFEIALEKIVKGEVLEDMPHPNQDRYPNQYIFVIKIEGYCYLVPYVEDKDIIFLKTMIPSRKMTKKYKGV